MKTVSLSASETISSTSSNVFSVISDSEYLGRSIGVPMTVLVEASNPGGVGTIRRVGPPLIGVEETIRKIEVNESIEYFISKNGGPIKNYHAKMFVSESADHVNLVWEMQFQTNILLSAPLKFTLSRLAKLALKRIKKHIETQDQNQNTKSMLNK